MLSRVVACPISLRGGSFRGVTCWRRAAQTIEIGFHLRDVSALLGGQCLQPFKVLGALGGRQGGGKGRVVE